MMNIGGPIKIGDPVTSYTDPCGCVWRNGKRVGVCARHRHKDGIKPTRPEKQYTWLRGRL